MPGAALLALHLITLTGPDNQIIEVNPDTVVSVREPRNIDQVHPAVRCLIHTTDGKVITVIDECAYVHKLLTEVGR
jgi:hypothetical protein